MKITSVTALPFAPDKIPDSYGIPATRNYVAVKVTTDEGVTGWGDATCGPLSVSAMVDEFGKLLVGKDPSRIEEHWQTLYHHFFVRGGPIQVSAISGIELALWDIKGKVLGVPIYEMLGGLMRDRIWAYGRWDGLTPEEAAEHALRNVSEGLTALKGDPFDHMGLFITQEAEKKAIETFRAVREAVGDEIELLVEVHGRLTPAAAIRIGNQIEPYRPFVFEEPVPFQNMDAMKRVADSVNIPIAKGERLYTKWDYEDLLKRQIVAMIQPDVIQAGGIMELKKIAAMAEAEYVGFQPHSIHGPMDVLAALHIDASTPNFMIHEGGMKPWFQDAFIGDFPIQKDGFLPVPTGVGLGGEMDEDWIKSHPPQEDAQGWAPPIGNLPSKQFNKWG